MIYAYVLSPACTVSLNTPWTSYVYDGHCLDLRTGYRMGSDDENLPIRVQTCARLSAE
jgi:hypothetical protein